MTRVCVCVCVKSKAAIENAIDEWQRIASNSNKIASPMLHTGEAPSGSANTNACKVASKSYGRF